MSDTRFGKAFSRFRRTPAFTGLVLFLFAVVLASLLRDLTFSALKA
jgi:hypothetical protein